MVWLCKFRGGINGWDLKILYRDLESWKKMIEKNEMKWNSLKDLKSWKKMKNGNGMEWEKWVAQTKGKDGM